MFDQHSFSSLSTSKHREKLKWSSTNILLIQKKITQTYKIINTKEIQHIPCGLSAQNVRSCLNPSLHSFSSVRLSSAWGLCMCIALCGHCSNKCIHHALWGEQKTTNAAHDSQELPLPAGVRAVWRGQDGDPEQAEHSTCSCRHWEVAHVKTKTK